MKSKLDLFFYELEKYLIRIGLESSETLVGHSKQEIFELENNIDFNLPYAYKLFLEKFAKGNSNFFDQQCFSIENLSYTRETCDELLTEVNISLPHSLFPFTDWQGYNFYYFVIGADNPEVYLYMEGDKSLKLENRKSGYLTNLICYFVLASVKIMGWNKEMDVDELLKELKKIEEIPFE